MENWQGSKGVALALLIVIVTLGIVWWQHRPAEMGVATYRLKQMSPWVCSNPAMHLSGVGNSIRFNPATHRIGLTHMPSYLAAQCTLTLKTVRIPGHGSQSGIICGKASGARIVIFVTESKGGRQISFKRLYETGFGPGDAHCTGLAVYRRDK